MLAHSAALIASIVSCYWTIVLIKLALARLRHHKQGVMIPRLATERRIWPVWVLVITGWHVFPWIAVSHTNAWWGLPAWAQDTPFSAIRMGAAIVALGLFAATISCWIAMGRHWSVAVLPGQMKTLVTTGPFRVVRHPIYSLSIQLMLCSLVVVPNLPMALVALAHITLMRMKVRIEETALAAEFGATWDAYAARTGKFLPQWGGSDFPRRQSPPAPKNRGTGRRQSVQRTFPTREHD